MTYYNCETLITISVKVQERKSLVMYVLLQSFRVVLLSIIQSCLAFYYSELSYFLSFRVVLLSIIQSCLICYHSELFYFLSFRVVLFSIIQSCLAFYHSELSCFLSFSRCQGSNLTLKSTKHIMNIKKYQSLQN